ncbi:MAG: hypothetical protein RIR00_2640 [Pseudomonadota bacterium]
MEASSTAHFRLLEDIARELSGEVNFPTCLDACLAVRNALRDPSVSLERLAQVIQIEPLISSKMLSLANSVAYNPSGNPVTTLGKAVQRVGFNAVRTTSLAVAMEQMLRSRHMACFEAQTRQLWEHSLEVASLARVLTRRLGRGNPDEALLAGLVHDIGLFYLLYRAAQYPELRDDPDELRDLIQQWHHHIGQSLLFALGLPEDILSAIRDHDQATPPEQLRHLGEILTLANLLAGGNFEWLPPADAAQRVKVCAALRQHYAELLADAQDDIHEICRALSG